MVARNTRTDPTPQPSPRSVATFRDACKALVRKHNPSPESGRSTSLEKQQQHMDKVAATDTSILEKTSAPRLFGTATSDGNSLSSKKKKGQQHASIMTHEFWARENALANPFSRLYSSSAQSEIPSAASIEDASLMMCIDTTGIAGPTSASALLPPPSLLLCEMGTPGDKVHLAEMDAMKHESSYNDTDGLPYLTDSSESLVSQCQHPDILLQLQTGAQAENTSALASYGALSPLPPADLPLPSPGEFLREAFLYDKNSPSPKYHPPAYSYLDLPEESTPPSSQPDSPSDSTPENIVNEQQHTQTGASANGTTSFSHALGQGHSLDPLPLFTIKSSVSVLGDSMQQKMGETLAHHRSSSANGGTSTWFSLSSAAALKSIYAVVDLDSEITNLDMTSYGSPGASLGFDDEACISISILLDANTDRVSEEQFERGKNIAELIYTTFKEFAPMVYVFSSVYKYKKICLVPDVDNQVRFEAVNGTFDDEDDGVKWAEGTERAQRLPISIDTQILCDFELGDLNRDGSAALSQVSSEVSTVLPTSLRNVFFISTRTSPVIEKVSSLSTICHTVSLSGDPIVLGQQGLDSGFGAATSCDSNNCSPWRDAGWTFTSLSTSFQELKEALKNSVFFPPITNLKVQLQYPPTTTAMPPVIVMAQDRVSPGCKLKYMLQFVIPRNYHEGIHIVEDNDDNEHNTLAPIDGREADQGGKDLAKYNKLCAIITVSYRLSRVQGKVVTVYKVMRAAGQPAALVSAAEESDSSVDSIGEEEGSSSSSDNLNYDTFYQRRGNEKNLVRSADDTRKSPGAKKDKTAAMHQEAAANLVDETEEDLGCSLYEYCDQADIMREQELGPLQQQSAEFEVVMDGITQQPVMFSLFG